MSKSSAAWPEERIHPFLWLLAELAGCGYDEMDRDAVDAGLATTDYHSDKWFEYLLSGKQTVPLRLSHDWEGSMVFVEFSGDPDLLAAVKGVEATMSSYTLSGGPYAPPHRAV